ncbi:MAG: serine/threonine protein kinase [Myxococcales bacterium]|nr:serine/threonine protein kinase [Myxococcales bacterium]
MVLPPGKRISGKYRIDRLLGRGGMGYVYAAENERLKKAVALKVLDPEVAGDPDRAERFMREAMAASQAKHPGVVEVYDADVDGELLWIAMELLEGESLEDRLRREPVSMADAVQIAMDVVDALIAVHAVGVIHRDLKPGNVYLETLPGGRERVKILDFGIAKVTVDEMDGLTRTGMAMGTPGYLSPEQATGKPDVDARADLYSVGVMLYEMLSGRLPYDARSFGELVAKMVSEGPRPLAETVPTAPAGLATLVDRCLAIDPTLRPADASELHDALASIRLPTDAGHSKPARAPRRVPATQLMEGTPEPALAPTQMVESAPTPTPTPAPSATPMPVAAPAEPRSGTGRLVGLAAVLVGALVVGGLVWLSTKPGDPPPTDAPPPPPPPAAPAVEAPAERPAVTPAPAETPVLLTRRRAMSLWSSRQPERVRRFRWDAAARWLTARPPSEGQATLALIAERDGEAYVVASWTPGPEVTELTVTATSDGAAIARFENGVREGDDGAVRVLRLVDRAGRPDPEVREWTGTARAYWRNEAPAWTVMRTDGPIAGDP